MQGTSTFDLSNWQLGTGGSWEHWWVENGTLTNEPGEAPACISGIEPLNISLPQNPIQANEWIYWSESTQLTKVLSVDGQSVNFMKTTDSFQLNVVPDGVYFLQGVKNEQPFSLKVVVCNSL
jgi:hypothetical protein